MAANYLVAILMGSQSDWGVMSHAAAKLEELGISHEARIISAHRKAARLGEFINESIEGGTRVFIAGAGGAAHLPGVVASKTTYPVLGVPMESKLMGGLDSLLSIVQMPKGIPVASLAVGKAGAINAAILAAQILSTSDTDIAARLVEDRKKQADALSEIPVDG